MQACMRGGCSAAPASAQAGVASHSDRIVIGGQDIDCRRWRSSPLGTTSERLHKRCLTVRQWTKISLRTLIKTATKPRCGRGSSKGSIFRLNGPSKKCIAWDIGIS